MCDEIVNFSTLTTRVLKTYIHKNNKAILNCSQSQTMLSSISPPGLRSSIHNESPKIGKQYITLELRRKGNHFLCNILAFFVEVFYNMFVKL